MLLNLENVIRQKVSRYAGLNPARLAFFCTLLFCGIGAGLINLNQNALAFAPPAPLYQAAATPAPTFTPQPSPTPAPTPTPQPSPTPGPANQTTTDKSDGPPPILVFFGIFVVGTLLAVFVSTRRIGRRR